MPDEIVAAIGTAVVRLVNSLADLVDKVAAIVQEELDEKTPAGD